MVYKVVGKRTIWRDGKVLLISRIEFKENSYVNQKLYTRKIMQQFGKDWIISVGEVHPIENEGFKW